MMAIIQAEIGNSILNKIFVFKTVLLMLIEQNNRILDL
jgi:hypothetical protein